MPRKFLAELRRKHIHTHKHKYTIHSNQYKELNTDPLVPEEFKT